MAERPTEALRRKIAGDPDIPESLDAIIDAIDTEVERLRGLLDDVRTDMTRRGQGGACNGCGEFADDGCTPHCLFTEIDAVLTPPADQPAPATVLYEIHDGFGSSWVSCDHPKCDLHVVRPGKSDCSGFCVPATEDER